MHSAIAIISKGHIDAIQLPTQKPGQGEVLVKVAYSTIVPPDVHMADFGFQLNEGIYPLPLGISISGFVEEVGEGAQRLQKGDRVCGFTLTNPKSKGLQQYAVLLQTTCAKIPDSLALEAAATIPDNFITSYFTLFDRLGLPLPQFPVPSPPPEADKPILIYGGGTSSGQYAIQLLNFAGYTNVITTSSSHHHTYLRSLGAMHTIDYKDLDMVEQVIRAAGGKLEHVMDCVSAEGTLKRIAQVAAPQATVAALLPIKAGDSLLADDMWMELPADRNPFEKSVKVLGVRTFLYQQNEYLKEKLMPEILPQLLEKGVITPNRTRLFDQGTFLERTLAALQFVRSGKVSGEKVVVKVE
jgi:NADPH:quinone reductase-like Zn-dependent oxidoreductase